LRAVIQRVTESSCTVDDAVTGRIGLGLMALIGVEQDDGEDDARLLADKVAGLRIFNDDDGKFNRSVEDVGGAILAVSQFTLLGDCRKGRRPSFTNAAPPDRANALYERVIALWRERGVPVETGRFQAHMKIHLINDGPVTMLIDSKKVF